MTNKKPGRLIIISAPSGAGKGTVLAKVLELRPELSVSVSATTRAPRAGEVDGVSYFFTPRGEFLDMIKNGRLLEYAEYVGEYYGTPKQAVFDIIKSGRDVILEIEVQGAKQVMSLMPEALTIFIVPPDMTELERRLRARGTDSEEKLAARLETAARELCETGAYSHVVVNDDVLRAANEILSILDGKEIERTET